MVQQQAALWWTLSTAPDLSVSAMSRPVDVNAQISQKKLAMWGTTDRILPEELDSREVWWRDRYKQLNNYGYLLRPRYSPQWVPSWKTSNKDWRHCEDAKRLGVCNLFSYRCTSPHVI